jgi:hypothetical protein
MYVQPSRDANPALYDRRPMPDPLATITFNPIIDDYLAAHALALTATTRHFRQWARIMLCIASWSATAVSLSIADALTIPSAIVGVVCSLVFILIFTAKMWPDPEAAARRTYDPRQNPDLLRKRTVVLEEFGIRMTTEVSENWLSWLAIRRVILTEQHLFVASRSNTFFIPARAFASQSDFLEFAKIAQDRYTPGEDETPPRGFAVVMKGR